MNNVELVGRLAKDPVGNITRGGDNHIVRFTVAVDRNVQKDGEQSADFIGCVAFGKTAEILEQYGEKGMLIEALGHIQTGSYEKDGQKIYTTSVIADRVKLHFGKKREENDGNTFQEKPRTINRKNNAPDGFEPLDDDFPF